MISEDHQKLQRKLGINPDTIILTNIDSGDYSQIVGVPIDRISTGLRDIQINFVHYFVNSIDEVIELMKDLLPYLSRKGILWLSWQKGSTGQKKGLSRDIIREIVLETDLVDCKICSVDEEWSALKFMFRLSRR